MHHFCGLLMYPMTFPTTHVASLDDHLSLTLALRGERTTLNPLITLVMETLSLSLYISSGLNPSHPNKIKGLFERTAHVV